MMTDHRRVTDAGGETVVAAEPERTPARRTPVSELEMKVRETDLEPYVGLRYLSKLFRLMALILALLLLAEIVTGLSTDGRAAIPNLLAEASRLIVLAGLLWGTGDLAILLVDIGHDVRAARILLGRRAAQHPHEHPESEAPATERPEPSSESAAR